MARKQLDTDPNNFDIRLKKVEQILPTLATKADVKNAIDAAVAPLATKAELAEGLNGLRIQIEGLKGDTQLLADSVLSLHRKFDRLAERTQ